MTEQELFSQIDLAIESFKEKVGFNKGIKVSKRPKSDWLVFNYRQITWKEGGINYLIEIYPSFDDQENIKGWNLYAAASYDENKKRYYAKSTCAENTLLDFIASNSEVLLMKGYQFLSNMKKEQIPFATYLK